MIHLLLVDAELELLPGEGGRREVLDQYISPEGASRRGSRRGRPDIVHAFLSLCQSSIANQSGRIKTWVHTRNDVVIEVERDAEVPPSYPAFLELMSRVLSGSEERGFSSRQETVQALLRRIDPKRTVVLTPSGEKTRLEDLFEKEEETVVVIGGFPEGDYLCPAYELATHCVSLGSDLLTVWTVTCEVLGSIPR